jgi:ChrB, C-terminal domain
MKWITRERPKIDRIACPWLVARFIDRDPEFLYVPATAVARLASETGAIPYDVPGVELTHVGEHCSFDAFLAKYSSTTRRCSSWRSSCAAPTRRDWSSRRSRPGCTPSRWACRTSTPTTTRCCATAW